MPASISSREKAAVHNVELLISAILRIGVGISLTLLIAGTLMSFLHHPGYASNVKELDGLTHKGAAFPHSVSAVLRGVADLDGPSIVSLGLLLLIATPVVRVAVSILAFIHLKDRAFILITSAVLALLLLSFLIGKGEGG